MRLKSLLWLLMSLVTLAFVVGGCSEDDAPTNPGTPTPTTYTGVMAGTGVSGTLAVVIPSAKLPATLSAEGDTIVITGTLDINGGGTVPLTGFLVVATGQIYLTGGGYTFVGALTGTQITGTFTYTGGNGVFTCNEGTSSNVKNYCGRYAENSPGTDAGAFNMTISGTTIYLIVYPDGEGGVGFTTTGTYNTTTYAITIHDPETGTVTIATGTLNPTANTISGSYNTGDAAGTWSGGLCN